MAPKKQKIVKLKQHRDTLDRPRKSQTATPAPDPAPKKLVMKIKLKSEPRRGALPPMLAYQFPLTAPPSDHASEEPSKEEFPKTNAPTVENGEIRRRGARQRTKTYQPDMAFGTEMDLLIASSAPLSKVEGEEDRHMARSPSAAVQSPERNDSSTTVQPPDLPPLRCTDIVSQDVSDILNTLQSSDYVEIDLPDLIQSENNNVIKPYTAAVLMELYIQCYESQLWNFCDLVADTWIRALHKANRRSHKSKNPKEHMWRENKALEKKFAQGKKGFKQDVQEFGLDVEDPKMSPDVTSMDPERLRDLFAYTGPDCGARLLWADAVALCGRRIEHEITKQPDLWPEGLFYDVMCTSLRMVGRKLTLKIEESYEGAWCRYHEHAKHGEPCYRRVAWMQQGGKRREYVARGAMMVGIVGEEGQADDVMDEDGQGSAKHVRFGDEDAVDPVTFGDVDAEGDTGTESESEED